MKVKLLNKQKRTVCEPEISGMPSVIKTGGKDYIYSGGNIWVESCGTLELEGGTEPGGGPDNNPPED